jgi:hypothetical protein
MSTAQELEAAILDLRRQLDDALSKVRHLETQLEHARVVMSQAVDRLHRIVNVDVS